MASKMWWTVFAVYEDTQEGYVTHVEAPDVAAAKKKAYREAESVILIAGVVEGKVMSVEETASDVTPLRGRGHAITVANIHISERKFIVPSKCPHCRADLRKSGAVRQVDAVGRWWVGHLTKSGDAVSAEKDFIPFFRMHDVVRAAEILCEGCKRHLWNGWHKEA